MQVSLAKRLPYSRIETPQKCASLKTSLHLSYENLFSIQLIPVIDI